MKGGKSYAYYEGKGAYWRLDFDAIQCSLQQGYSLLSPLQAGDLEEDITVFMITVADAQKIWERVKSPNPSAGFRLEMIHKCNERFCSHGCQDKHSRISCCSF